MMERSTNVGATSAIGETERFVCRHSVTNGVQKWQVIALLHALLMVCFYAQAQKVLVKDVNTAVVYHGSKPHEFTEYKGLVYFFADSYRKGVELWKTDGTEAGTQLVKDINSGSGNAKQQEFNMIVFNNALYFMATDGNGPALWKSDGTEEGTVKIVDPLEANGNIGWRSLTAVNNTLYFYVQDYSAGGFILWKSDGTTAGTKTVGPRFNYVTNLIDYNGTLFFQGDGELWKSDGTDAGTVMVKDIYPGSGSSDPENFKVFKNELYFAAKEGRADIELWKTDGTASGTVLVKGIHPTDNSNPRYLTVLNDFLYFVANDDINGAAIWKTDGTTAGTTLFTDPMPEYSSNDFLGMSSTNGTLFYSTQDPTITFTLWKSDGTAEGTRKLVVNEISGSSGFTTVNNTVYFSAYAPGVGNELWKTDGTPEGTSLVKDITEGTNHSYPSFFFAYKDRLYFQADDAVNGAELWTSNGTAEGTHMAVEIYKEASSSAPVNLTKIGNKVFYSADDGIHGNELWITDGTNAGTHIVKNIFPDAGGSYPGIVTEVNGIAYFQAIIETGGRALLRSDGTEAGTAVVKDFGLNDLKYLTNLNGMLYFSVSQNGTGRELWKSDGTPEGTVLVKDIYPGAEGGNPSNLINVNGTLYFSASNGNNGVELWKSDGTEAGTVMVKDIFINASSAPADFFNANGTLYFTATDATHGQELWKSDGTEAGTVMVKDINPGTAGSYPKYFCLYQNALYFAAGDDVSGTELWKSDGTAEGTSMVRDIAPGDYAGRPYFLTVFKGDLYFVARTVDTGYELWKSDGSQGGTVMVKDIWEGNDSSYPGDFRVVNDALYFIAEDINDVQVWRTHGIECSTISTTGQSSGYVLWNWMVELNGKLLFSAFTTETGHELFMHDTALDGPSCTQTIAFESLGDKTYGESKTIPLSAQASSKRSVLFFSENDDVVSIRDNIATINNAGTVTITAKQQGDHIYLPATAEQALKVNKAQQTITFANLPGKTMGDGPFALPATSSSGLPVMYVSSNEAVSVIDGNTVALTGRGQTTIRASQPGNRNYEPAPDQQQILVVDGRNQVIEFGTLHEKIFGEESFTLSATATSSLPVTYQSSEPSVAVISGNTVTLKGAGTTIITAVQEGNHEYNPAAAVVQTLVVNLVTGVEQFPDKAIRVYPNPVTDFLTVSGISSGARSELLDAAGRSLYVPQSAYNDASFKLDVQHLKPGMYHLMITTGNGVSFRTIIKK